ncbi:helix-turn-helix domain-containing protein [Thermomonospora umbrina]|uniref:Helix-turn-helix protein n=1 Tax=Thermomonospora umbrina TaxID=111806 RepID=A0A3D9T5S5_9ACTN|nr:helix-turn-helix transcriptional regulator [Thermomonospora umbrina]REF00596.1 helix-turn-helix protein [Thermomonospora umbrina]
MSRLMLLGRRLTELRTAAGMSIVDAADDVDVPADWLANVEGGKGRSGLVPLVERLAALYDVREVAERGMLVDLAAQNRLTHWWRRFGALVDDDYAGYLEVEQLASTVGVYEASTVPELLQTPAYARALLAVVAPGADLDRRVELLRARQHAVRDNGTEVRAVIDEAALRRPVGGAEVMRAQLEHLAGACDRPDVTVQVHPLAYAGHIPPDTRTTVLTMPCALPHVVYVQHSVGAHFPVDVGPHLAAFGQAVDGSPPTGETRDILAHLAKTL